MSKGRATATFTVAGHITNGVATIAVTVPVEPDSTFVLSNDDNESIDYGMLLDATDINGTVALGKFVAELGKVATPISARDKRVAAAAAEFVSEGMSEARALELADKFVK